MIQTLSKAREAVEKAQAVLITAGAGMGVDSGLPDFRSNNGFWRAYPQIAKLGKSFEQMATPQWFQTDPHLAWAFYGHRLNLYRATTPHLGFGQLLELGETKAGGYFVFTSNVDGQFQKAGYAADQVYECHGSIHHLQCAQPCCQEIWPAERTEVKVEPEHFVALDPLPQCPHCRGIARPNILMFDDWNWLAARSNEQASRLSGWLAEIRQQRYSLVIIESGAGMAIPSVRHFSESTAVAHQALLIRINPLDHLASPSGLSLPLGAAEGIRRILGQE